MTASVVIFRIYIKSEMVKGERLKGERFMIYIERVRSFRTLGVVCLAVVYPLILS